MKVLQRRMCWIPALAVSFALAPALGAQTTKMPTTPRWGTGHVDVPSAAVLPHLALVGTASGFWVDIDNNLAVSEHGWISGTSGPFEEFYQDAAVALGLFNRIDLGVVLHSLNDGEAGGGSGTLAGAFGQLALLSPGAASSGLGFAVGLRTVTQPDYGSGGAHATGRLGFPDNTFRSYGPDHELNTQWTSYAVASAFLQGLDNAWLPMHDFTFSLGWGNGLFRSGASLPWYSFVDSNGWFGGATVHVGLGEHGLLNLSGDWNGFDLNLGAQLDLNWIRVGVHHLGVNYTEGVSVYRSPKLGVLASLALCPGGDSVLCRAQLIERPASDTIQLPAPPPDTIMVTREVAPPLPTGEPTDICLATGDAVTVQITQQGDTLVGPSRASLRELRQSGVGFAGDYAQGRAWFEGDEPLTFEQMSYQQSGDPVRLECPDIMRVGEYQGVALFARRDGERPYRQLYVPVRPGVWQMYENLRPTRG